ncbi:uncharacterized protein LOC143248803 [Tachypleus tridentatus]|uniref:uncharacterized protein LOC143248803 n=1 Tax=Tachypleus tridentatus TaxID=6853 RepID=UPI003FD2B9D6
MVYCVVYGCKTVRHRAKASFRFRARRRNRQGGDSGCGWSIGRTGLLHTMQSFVKITLNAHVLCRLRTDLSLQRTGSTTLKPSLAITKRTNLKVFREFKPRKWNEVPKGKKRCLSVGPKVQNFMNKLELFMLKNMDG